MTDPSRLKQDFRKTLAMEEVRLLVQEEGRAARNLIAFSVPVDQTQPESYKLLSKKPPTSPRLPFSDGKKEDCLRPTKRSSTLTKSRVRSASTGRDKKSELQARYWAFLFGNLQRAVDDIYQTCETDESITECKEVIMVLENYTRDFHNLIEWFKLKWEYENTPPPQRPTSLAWEVRKSSPGKVHTLSSFEKEVSSKHIIKSENGKQDPIENSTSSLVNSLPSSPPRSITPQERNKSEDLTILSKFTSENSNSAIESNTEPLSVLSVVSEVDEAKKDHCFNSEQCESIPLLAIASTIHQETTNQSDLSGSGSADTTAPIAIEDRSAYINEKSDDNCHELNKNIDSEAIGNTAEIKQDVNDDQFSSCAGEEEEIVKTMVSQASQTEEEQTGWEASLAAPSQNQLPPTDCGTSNKVSLPSSTMESMTCSKDPSLVQSSNENLKNSKVSSIQVKPTQIVGQKPMTGKNEDSVNSGPVKDATIVKAPITRIGGRGRGVPSGSMGVKSADAPGGRVNQRTELELARGRGRAEVPKSRIMSSRLVTGRVSLGGPAVGVAARPGSAVNPSTVPKLTRSRTVVEGTGSVSSSWSVKRQSSTETASRTNRPIPSAMRQPRPSSGTSSTGGVNTCRTNLGGLVRKDVRSHSSLNNIQTRSSWAVHHCGSSRLAEQQHPRGGRKSASNSSLHSSTSSTSSASTVRSWADKVKGGGTEVAKTSPEVASPSATGELKYETQIPEATKKAVDNEDDDSQGWETVRNRSSRSRVSPASKVAITNDLKSAPTEAAGGMVSSLSRSAGNITKVLAKKDLRAETSALNGESKIIARRSFPQTRFQRPSSATSLPALSSIGGNSNAHSPSPPKESKNRSNGKKNVNEFGKMNAVNKKMSNLNSTNNQKMADGKENNDTSKSMAIEVSQDRDLDKRRKSKDNGMKSKCNSVNEEGLNGPLQGKENISSNGDIDDVSLINKVKIKHPSKATKDFEKKSRDAKSEEGETNLLNEEVLRQTEELCAEEEKLKQEIMELEKTEIEVDTETEEIETDGEAAAGPGDEEDERPEVVTPEDRETIEAKYENMLAGMSLAERKEALEQLEAMAARHPGRALELHQKLSSPSRKRSLAETLRRYQAKQAQAEEKRQRLKELKATKLRELFRKIGEVREAQVQNIEAKREQLEKKLRRAEEKRKQHLQGIVRKAHDEEEKLKEIAFINELEAQNKRHDFMALCQEQEERLLGIIEERQRRQEEKAAKEAAVEERRKALEAERQAKLEVMQERRRKREERIDREQQEKEKERLELAREKARDREERRSALQAAQLANQEELQRKIRQKQEESARRHDHNMELIRQRALALESSSIAGRGPGEESSLPRLSPYETNKFCNLCNVLIESEVYLLSHLRGKKHQESLKSHRQGSDGHSIKESPSPVNMSSMEHIVDATDDKIDPKIAQDRERQKALKKRCKKIRQRMAQKGQEYESALEKSQKSVDSANKSRLQKCIKDVEKLNHSQGKGQWPDTAITALERALGEINRILDKQNVVDKIAFQALGGFAALTSILDLVVGSGPNVTPSLPPKCYITTCTTYNLACNGCPENSKYVLLSNKITTVLDFLLQRLSSLIPFRRQLSNSGGGSVTTRTVAGTPPVDPVAGALMRLLSLVLSFASSESQASSATGKGEGPPIRQNVGGPMEDQRIQDVICYAVSVGVVDKLASYCGGVRDPIDSDPAAAHFLLGAIGLISTLAACSASIRGVPKTNKGTASGSGDSGRSGKGIAAGATADPLDPTQLVSALQATEIVGAASMLYGMLLHQGAPARTFRDAASSSDASDEESGLGGGTSPLPSPVPPALPPHTLAVTLATFRLFGRVAELDLYMFQGVLGAEGISLQFRHIASYLLWYCSHHRERELLHEVVRVVGFFAVGNHDNQNIVGSLDSLDIIFVGVFLVLSLCTLARIYHLFIGKFAVTPTGIARKAIIQSGYMPTVLQQLCSLPFEYFSSPPLTKVLFPTLLACCRGNRQNRHILEREVSYQLLEDFRSSDDAKGIVLVRLVSEQTSNEAEEEGEEGNGSK